MCKTELSDENYMELIELLLDVGPAIAPVAVADVVAAEVVGRECLHAPHVRFQHQNFLPFQQPTCLYLLQRLNLSSFFQNYISENLTESRFLLNEI